MEQDYVEIDNNRFDLVKSIHRKRIDLNISTIEKDLGYLMVQHDKIHKSIDKALSARIFLFNQDSKLREVEQAKTNEDKQKAYNDFMDIFINPSTPANASMLECFCSKKIVESWLDNLIMYADDEAQQDLKTVLAIIDKYYNKEDI